MWDKLVLSTVDILQLYRKCTILNLSLPCSVQATACTSPEPDEYRLSRIACPYVSVSLWNRNFTLENGFRADFKKGNFYFVTHCMCSTTCNAMCHPPINQTFISFLWVWNVTSYIERTMCFEELWGKTLWGEYLTYRGS